MKYVIIKKKRGDINQSQTGPVVNTLWGLLQRFSPGKCAGKVGVTGSEWVQRRTGPQGSSREVEYSLLQTQGRVGKAAVETQAQEAKGRRVHTAQLPQRSFLCAKKKLLGSSYF